MSGDMNTALGNVIIMILALRTYMEPLGITYVIIDDGDDAGVIVEAEDEHRLAGLAQFYAELGLPLKVEPSVSTLEHIVFCQSQPVQVSPDQWRMVRDPRVALSKDATTVHPVTSETDFWSLRRSIAECGMALAGDLPVFGAYYNAMLRGTDGAKVRELRTGMEWLARGMHAKYTPPTECNRLSFAKAFGIWPAEQESLEQYYHSLVPDKYEPVEAEKFYQPHDVTLAVAC
jgi:hypothetical protein